MDKANQGTGFRLGICQSTCADIYRVCKDALFYFNPGSSHAQLVVCKKDSLICSRLRDIATTAEESCAMLGLQINDRKTMDEDFVLKVISGLNVNEEEVAANAMCYNFTSSYQLYGRSPLRLNRTVTEQSSLFAIKICLLISLVVVVLVI